MLSVTRVPANCPLCPKPPCGAPTLRGRSNSPSPHHPVRQPWSKRRTAFQACPSPAVAWEVTLDRRHWGIPFQSPDPELTARHWQLRQPPSWKTLKKGKSQVADGPLCGQ